MSERTSTITPAGLALRGLSRALRALPRGAALAVGAAAGGLLGSVIRFRRREVQATLRRCFPEKSEAELRRILTDSYRHLGLNLVEVLRLQTLSVNDLLACIEMEGEEHFRAAWARGKGVLALSAHLGNWEYLVAGAPSLGFRPAAIIAKPIRNPGVNRVIAEARARFGLQAFPPHHAYRACLGLLRRNQILGFVLDQNMMYEEGVFVDFFGRTANTTPGLAILAAQSGAPVLPIFAVRLPGGRHRLCVQPPLDPPPDREPETIRAHTQRYTRLIEEAIRAHPEQWLWLHRRWKTQPKTPADTDGSQGLRNPKPGRPA